MNVRVVMSLMMFLVYQEMAYSNNNIHKGVINISGTVSYNQFRTKGSEKTKQFNLSPKFMYFVQNNIGVGALISYRHENFSFEKIKGYAVGPVIRYYITQNDINPFVSYEYTKSSNEITGGLSGATSFDATINSFGLGVDYFVSENVAVEAELKYSRFDREISDQGIISQNITYESVDSSINFGIGVFF